MELALFFIYSIIITKSKKIKSIPVRILVRNLSLEQKKKVLVTLEQQL